MTHCCVSPERKFEVPYLGKTLAQNKKVDVTLPDGIISDEGLKLITNYLYRQGWFSLSDDVGRGRLGNEWKTDRGTFTKRLRQRAHSHYAMSLGETYLSEIGNLARDHSKGATLRIATTRHLNGSAASFANSDSCWWTDYRKSRCAFKTNGGFGLRSFGPQVRAQVWGRAWVFPVNENNDPTFDALNAAGFVVFNGYGNLGGMTGPRVMAALTGMTYKRVQFRVHLNSTWNMQINGYTGYLLTPDGTGPDRLQWDLPYHAEKKELVAA